MHDVRPAESGILEQTYLWNINLGYIAGRGNPTTGAAGVGHGRSGLK